MRTRLALFSALSLIIVAVAACGGEHAHVESGEHHHEMKGPVGAFHSVLAPIWHSAKGPERVAKACDQAKTMAERAAAVEAAPPPAGPTAEAYKAASKELSASVTALATACAAPGRADAEAKFTTLHDAFHKVMDQAGGKHEHH